MLYVFFDRLSKHTIHSKQSLVKSCTDFFLFIDHLTKDQQGYHVICLGHSPVFTGKAPAVHPHHFQNQRSQDFSEIPFYDLEDNNVRTFFLIGKLGTADRNISVIGICPAENLSQIGQDSISEGISVKPDGSLIGGRWIVRPAVAFLRVLWQDPDVFFTGLPIVRSLCFDNNRPSRKNQRKEKEYCKQESNHVNLPRSETPKFSLSGNCLMIFHFWNNSISN